MQSNVFQTMFGQALHVFKSFAALITGESLFHGVGYCVALQITNCNKTAAALVTLLWLFSHMCTPHVNCQLTSCDA